MHDLDAARAFYGGILGCTEGRSSNEWIDFDFFGHQLVTHLASSSNGPADSNEIDGKHVPLPHFGVVLPMTQWQALSERLKKAGMYFEVEPYIRFKGEVGEQATMFFFDPRHNALEFKAFANIGQLFAK